MRGLGVWVGLFLLSPLAAGCSFDVVCCERGTGEPVRSERGMCADAGFPVVADSVCEGIADVDRDLADHTDVPDDAVDEQLERCQSFCGAEQALCPGDALCLESCEHSACAPDDAAIRCAQESADCTAVGDCWDMAWFQQVAEGDTDEPTCPT